MAAGAIWGGDIGGAEGVRVIWDTDFTDEHGIRLKNEIHHRAAERTEKLEALKTLKNTDRPDKNILDGSFSIQHV